MDYLDFPLPARLLLHEKATKGKHMENLNRGVSAAYTGSGVLVSWRHLATDNEKTTFDLWRIRERRTILTLAHSL